MKTSVCLGWVIVELCVGVAQEVSDAAAVLAEGSLAGPLDRQRRLRWAERLKVTQCSLPTRVRLPVGTLHIHISSPFSPLPSCAHPHLPVVQATGKFGLTGPSVSACPLMCVSQDCHLNKLSGGVTMMVVVVLVVTTF